MSINGYFNIMQNIKDLPLLFKTGPLFILKVLIIKKAHYTRIRYYKLGKQKNVVVAKDQAPDKIGCENSCYSLNLAHEPAITDDLLAVVNCCRNITRLFCYALSWKPTAEYY